MYSLCNFRWQKNNSLKLSLLYYKTMRKKTLFKGCLLHLHPPVLQPPAALILGSKVPSGSWNHKAHFCMR